MVDGFCEGFVLGVLLVGSKDGKLDGWAEGKVDGVRDGSLTLGDADGCVGALVGTAIIELNNKTSESTKIGVELLSNVFVCQSLYLQICSTLLVALSLRFF